MAKNNWLGLALVAALMLNALLPFFAVHRLPANAAHLSSAFGEKILICTGEGFKWVNLADLQSGKEKPKPHANDKCPLCFAAAHGMNILAASAHTQLHQQYHACAIAYDPAFIALHALSPASARAPPFSSLS